MAVVVKYMLSNQQIKVIKSLSKVKHRQKYNIFIVEGYKAVYDLIRDIPDHIQYIVQGETFANQNANSITQDTLKMYTVTDKIYRDISSQSTPSGIMAIVNCIEKKDSDSFVTKAKLTIYLDKINDPGNMGTLLRIADWYGVDQIILPKGNVDIHNSKVVQSAMGSLWRHNYVYAEIEELDLSNVYSVGADMQGTSLVEFKKETYPYLMLVMGNESNGISSNVAALLDDKITIEKRTSSNIDSLNVAVASAIILEGIT